MPIEINKRGERTIGHIHGAQWQMVSRGFLWGARRFELPARRVVPLVVSWLDFFCRARRVITPDSAPAVALFTRAIARILRGAFRDTGNLLRRAARNRNPGDIAPRTFHVAAPSSLRPLFFESRPLLVVRVPPFVTVVG